jgi:hypothetical protein
LGFRALLAYVTEWARTAHPGPKIITKKPAPRGAPRRQALARLRRR